MKTLLALSIGLALLLGCSQDDTSNDVYQEPAPTEELPASTSASTIRATTETILPAPTEELPAATTIPTETTIILPWQSCEEIGREILYQRNVTLFEENSDYILSLDDTYPLTVNMLESHERACMLQITSRERFSAMPSWRDEPNEFSFSGVACYNDYTWFWGGASEERIVLQIEDCLVPLRSSPREESPDDLEAQRPDVYSPCEPWEIFDLHLEARGLGGGYGSIDSSGVGCIRVCYVRFTPASVWTDSSPTAGNLTITGAQTDTYVDLTGTKAATTAELRFSRSNWHDSVSSTSSDDVTFAVNGDRSVDSNGNTSGGVDMTIALIEGSDSVANLEIRVATNQRYCQVWNTTTDEEELRSVNQNPEGIDEMWNTTTDEEEFRSSS